MKKNEIIELNGEEYTVELNRESFIQIDKICNIQKSMKVLQSNLYEYVDEIDDDYVPFGENFNEEDFEKQVKEKEEVVHKLITRSFFIWLYPHHKLKISEVETLLKPYLEDEEKATWLVDKVQVFLNNCVDMKESQDKKNL